MLRFCSFSSGSSGNCYLVRTDRTALLVDAGIPLRRIRDGLSRTETPEEAVRAVLVTHEHSDHIRSLGALIGPRGLKRRPAESGETAPGEGDTDAGEACGEPLLFYATRETWEALEDQPALMGCRFEGKRECCFCEPFRVGDIVVEPFHLSHDAAAATGYSFTADGRKLTIITDTGVITDEIRDHARGSDLLVLEANHDVEMLRIGGYPWFLKQRILGPYGHLSNDTAAELVCDLLREGMAPGTVALAHLSQQNNFPEMAWQTLANALEEQGFVLGRDIAVKILVRDTISEVFTV